MAQQPAGLHAAAAAHADAADAGSRLSQQGLRRTRNLIAATTALLLPGTLLVYAYWGVIPARVAYATTGIVAGTIGVFFLLFRTGLNRRFRDASLTTEQILAAIATLAFVTYAAAVVRDRLIVFYCMALVFGAFRFERERMLVLALTAIATHGGVLAAWHWQHPEAEPASSMIDMVVLVVVLPWFAIIGGYVNSLRFRFVDSNRRLRSALTRIEEIAVRDELTGCFNRRYIMETLQREISRAQRAKGTFSICLLDLDHFKSVNDTWGHAAGDTVLKRFAVIASAALRDVDQLGRYGGEEFLVVLPGADVRGGVVCGERIRAGLEQCEWPELQPSRKVTVTAGIATWRQGDSAYSILARADDALYAGKNAGRNRVTHMD